MAMKKGKGRRIFFQNKFHGTKTAAIVDEETKCVSATVYKRVVHTLCPCGGSPNCACGVFRECAYMLEPVTGADGKLEYARLVPKDGNPAMF